MLLMVKVVLNTSMVSGSDWSTGVAKLVHSKRTIQWRRRAPGEGERGGSGGRDPEIAGCNRILRRRATYTSELSAIRQAYTYSKSAYSVN